MCIQTNNDLSTAPAMSEDRERNLQILQRAPPQTLVFWDDNIGPNWFRSQRPRDPRRGISVAAGSAIYLAGGRRERRDWWLATNPQGRAQFAL